MEQFKNVVVISIEEYDQLRNLRNDFDNGKKRYAKRIYGYSEYDTYQYTLLDENEAIEDLINMNQRLEQEIRELKYDNRKLTDQLKDVFNVPSHLKITKEALKAKNFFEILKLKYGN